MIRTWLPDPSHYPEQMTPLSATVWFEAMGRGVHEAARELRAPFGGFATRLELGWAYEGELEPDWEVDRGVLGRRRWGSRSGGSASCGHECWRSTPSSRRCARTAAHLQKRPSCSTGS